MRACLLVCAALALAPCRATAAHAPPDPRLDRIKSHILAKLGLTSRPTAVGAPPRDVVRQILAHAADPAPRDPAPAPIDEHAMREVIAIAHRDKCSLECKAGSSQFAPGQKYNYGIEGTVNIALSGAEKQETGVQLLGQVSVTATGGCVLELAVQNLVISGPGGKKYESPTGIDKPIQFSLQEGRLGAEICAQDGDTRRSLNIKRAIISLLQTETKSGTQYDIFGACPTEISSSQEGGAALVHRARDLSRCAHRENNDVVASIFNPTAEIKESQILQSSLNVESKVVGGVPEKVLATEQYVYKPFAVGDNGAVAAVRTKLTLNGKSAGAAQSQCTVPRTVIFESPHGTQPAPNNVNSALHAVKDAARSVSNEATEKSAGNFAQLVWILRATSKDDLIKVFNQVKGNSQEKRVYLDALLRTGTGASIEASIQLATAHSLDELEQLIVLMSLGNARHVTDAALKAATALLDDQNQNLPKEFYINVGALAGAYCRQHNCHSKHSDGIAALSQKFAAKIGNCRQKNKKDEDAAVIALKGIRKIQHLEDSLIDKLVHAAQDHNVKARVKAAVLEAFLADPCSPKIKKASLDILKNRQLDSEIRIKAYQAVIACPCGRSANEIKNLIENEPVHQVGRFITSSLRAIRSSANPDKQLAKQHYGQISIPRRFNVDDRKYSFFREQSFAIDALGAGGSLDEAVIYSQDSFLPRSINLNLTAQVFGHSFNVIELGGRQGNLDLVVEHFLGPKGVLRTKGAQALYDAFKNTFQQTNDKVNSALNRRRRSVKSEIDAFDKNLKAEATAFDNELDLDLYLQVFGTDSVFLSLGDSTGFDLDRAINKFVEMLASGAKRASHFSKELRANLLFLDAELAYPTLSGFPLKLAVSGAATARLDVASNFDINDCLRNPQTAKVDIKLVPSTDVEISGVMLIDADAVIAGLKVVANLHSSTGGHLVAKVLENGRGFDVQFGLPVEKQEIVVATNEVLLISAEKGQKDKQTKIDVGGDRKDYSGCFDQLSGLLGLTLCGEVSLPFAISGPEGQASISQFLTKSPITGISKVKLVLEKNDLKSYHFRGLYREDNGRNSFELLLDAEGSKNRRTQLTGEYVNNREEISVKLGLDSPIKVLSGEISARRTPTEFAALVKAKIDAQEYFGRIGFNVQGNDQRSVYKPVFEYQLDDGQGKKSLQVDGQIIREYNAHIVKYTFENFKLNMPSSKEPIAIEGYISDQDNLRNVEFELSSKFASAKGNVKNNDINLEFTNQLNPLINFRLKGHSEYGDVIKNEFDVVHSNDLRDASKRVIFSQYLKYNLDSSDNYNVITKNKFEIVSVPFKIEFDADVDPKKVESDLELVTPNQQAAVELKARTHIKDPEDYRVKLLLKRNKNEIEFFSKRDCINSDKSNFENYISVKNVAKYELSGVVLHRNTEKDSNVGAVGNLKITGSKNEEVKFDIGAIRNPSLYSSHAKVSSSSQGELVDFFLKSSVGPNMQGQLKLVLKNTLSANGQFQSTGSNGGGNGAIIFDFKKSQRKVKADVKITAGKPTLSADIDIYLNFEKDNNDKICFKTNTNTGDNSFDSKNVLEYGGKKSELNVKLVESGQLKGATQGSVEVVLPTERCLVFAVDRNIKVDQGVYNGNAKVSLSDSPKRGSEGSSISYQAKITNTNFDKDTIDYQGTVDVAIKDGKKLTNTFSIKNIPEGDKFKFDFKSQLNGNMIPKPASLSASAVYLDSITKADDKYQLKASYGDDISLDIGGVNVVKADDKGESKYVDDYTVSVQLPLQKVHDIKLVHTIVFHQPAARDTVEYTIIESVQIDSDVYKVDANGKLSAAQGSGTMKVLVPHVDPVVLDANYKINKASDKIESAVEVKTKYGKGKTVSLSLDSAATAAGKDLVFKSHTPNVDSLKKLEITVHSKNPTPDTYSSSIIVDADGRIYNSESTIVLSKAHPILDLKYTSPSNPKTSKIYIQGSSLSSTQGKMEVKIENVRDVSLDLTSEASVQKDNVNVKVHANSEKLGLKGFEGVLSTKDAGNGKRLEFHSTNDGKNVMSGSTSFISKQEGPKTIIEGSGSVKIKEEQKSANFKYIRTILTDANEKGVEQFFNVAFGDRSYVAESRVTNREYKMSHVYCEEKKQCAHAEIQSKIDISKPGVIANVLNAGFDLRKLGIAPEVGLVVRDQVSSTQLPQYTLDLHASKDDRKYHLRVYDTPAYGHSKSGISLQLPSRTLLLEQSVRYPTDKKLPFPIKGELVLDLDKTKPGHKAAAWFLVDADVDSQDKQTALAELGFSHPKMRKDGVIRIRGSAIRSGENTVKIETSAVASHSCFGHDREGKILFEASPNHFKFLLNTPLVKVLDLEAKASVRDALQQADIRFTLLEGAPVQAALLARDYKHYELSTGYSAEADRKLTVVLSIDPEKRVDLSADIILSGQKKNLARGALFIEDNLIKSDFGSNKDNQAYFLNALKKDLDGLEARVKQLGEKASKDFKEIAGRLETTSKELEQAYSDDLRAFYQEIADDKVLKELSQGLHDIAVYMAKLIDEVIQATKPIVDRVTEIIVHTVKKIQELYEKQIEPELKQLYSSISSIIRSYLDGVVELVAHVAALLQDFVEKHKPELQDLINSVAEIFKDITRIIVAHAKEYRKQVAAFVEETVQYFKDLPFIEAIKEKYEELAVPEQVVGVLEQAHALVRPLLPTTELQNFADTTLGYILKKLRKEQCNDNAELRAVYQRGVEAAASLIQLARSYLTPLGGALPGFDAFGLGASSLSGSGPSLGGSVAFSFIRQIINGDLPDLAAIVKAYRPRSLNPLDEVPAKLRAVVVNGQHIFTFDGRHLSFPGTCRYVLAHDHVDRNFTLAIQLAGGLAKALVLEDKSGTIIEIKDNGQVMLNGASHGFPVEEKDSFAFRQPSGRVGLGTEYGLLTFCTSKLDVCYIEVSGFYLGKLRGLLGDGNNEPYDDFRLPNGKISNSESEFGNAYRLARSCPAATAPPHSHAQHHAPLPPPCETVFGGSSPLKHLAYLVDIAPFRQACIHAIAFDQANGLKQACDLGRGYAALALTGLVPAVMPRECVQCTDADKPRDIGDMYDVTLPGKQADIVVIVETTKSNEKTFRETVVPLVAQVVEGLKAKKITDVKVYLVGATSRMPYAILYDTDQKLKNAKVLFTDKSRYNRLKPLVTGFPRIDDFIDEIAGVYDSIVASVGGLNVDAAYSSALELPFRAGAVKYAIGVVGDKCFHNNLLQEVRSVAYQGLLGNFMQGHALIAPTETLTIGNGKNAENVVGFDEHHVIMLGDKKAGKDSEALRQTLKYGDNGCVEFNENAGGLILSSSTFEACGAPQQKQWLSTASGAILQQMLHQRIEKHCTCAYADPFRAKSMCYVKDRKEVARRRK